MDYILLSKVKSNDSVLLRILVFVLHFNAVLFCVILTYIMQIDARMEPPSTNIYNFLIS